MRQNLIGSSLNKTDVETLRTLLCHISKDKDVTVKVSFYTTGTQKKIDCFKGGGFCAHFNTVFEAIGCFYDYCPCREARPSLTEEDFEHGNKKREMDQMRNQYVKKRLKRCWNMGT